MNAGHESEHDDALLGSTAIVVVNYGDDRLLRENLRVVSAAAAECPVVVVDNFSTRANRLLVDACVAEFGWIGVFPDRNEGFGTGMNLGVAAAISGGAHRFVLLNPDAVIARADLVTLAGIVSRDPMVLTSPIIRNPDGSLWFSGSDLYLADGRTRSRRHRDAHGGEDRVEWLTGACVVISEALWARLEGFSDDYFLYWEDVDLSWRAVAAGASLMLCEDAVAVHDEGGTQDRAGTDPGRAKSPAYYYYNIRNRLVFAALNLPREDAERWSRLAWRSAREVVLRGGRRQLIRPWTPLGAAYRGVRDGRRFLRSASRAAVRPTDPARGSSS